MSTPDPLPAFLDRLDALASKATPGPWTARIPSSTPAMYRPHVVREFRDAKGRRNTYYVMADGGQNSGPDSEHIAACDPATVRALVAVARAATMACIGHECLEPIEYPAGCDALRDALAALRAVVPTEAPHA